MNRRVAPPENREPEKTPLIDMVFLLLIFFLVTVAGLKQVEGKRESRAAERVEADLLRSTRLEGVQDSAHVLLLEVLDLNDRSDSLLLMDVRRRLLECAEHCHEEVAVPELGAARFWVVTTPLDQLEDSLGASVGGGCNCESLRFVIHNYPIPLDMGLVDSLRRRFEHFDSAAVQKQLHVRMPVSTPVSFLGALYEFVLSSSWIQPKSVYVRALEEGS
jgi:hypothetical protein